MSESARNKAGWLLIFSVTVILAAVAVRLCPDTWTPIRAATAFGSGTALLFALLAFTLRDRGASNDGPVGRPREANRHLSDRAATLRGERDQDGSVNEAGARRERCSPPKPDRFLTGAARIGLLKRDLKDVAAIAAVWAGSLAGSLLVYLAVVRAVYEVMEVLRGGPIAHDPVFDSGWDVLIEIAALMAACLIGLRASRRRTLIPIMFWLAVLGVIWTTLQWPMYSQSEQGTFARSAVAVLAVIGLSATVSTFVGLESIGRLRGRWRAARTNPDALLEAQPDSPGMRPSVGAVAIALILLVCFTLTAPPTETLMAPWLAALVTAGCALAAGTFCFVLVGRRWSVNLSDAALGLITLSFAALAVACVPSDGIGLQERYPMIFTAVIVALGLSSWMGVWLARVWRQQLDGGQPWTTAGRLVPVCEAFSFFAACIGLILAWLMAIWPKLRGVGVSDDSPGRMTAGVAALLYLLLVMLWNGRALKRPSFHVLAALAIAALVCFIVVRAAPFASATVTVTIAAPSPAGPW